MRLTKGYIQIYTGDGKGKTTAALGQAFRALGHDLKVYVIQFMKGNIEYGELEMSRRLSPSFTLRQMGRETFVNKKDPAPEDVRLAKEALRYARECIEGRISDILILDEINVALDFGLIPISEVLDLLKKKPVDMELILTGRNAPKELVKAADLVTEMKEVRHYYQKGVKARVGIER